MRPTRTKPAARKTPKPDARRRVGACKTPVPVEWHDSAWLPRVIVRGAVPGIPGGAGRKNDPACPSDSGMGAPKAPWRLPRLRLEPLAVFGLEKTALRPGGRAHHAPRLTYLSLRSNSL